MSKVFKFYFLTFFWNFCMNKIWNFASRFFHVLGKAFDFVLAKKQKFCGRKIEISSPLVENFDCAMSKILQWYNIRSWSQIFRQENLRSEFKNLSAGKRDMNISNS